MASSTRWESLDALNEKIADIRDQYGLSAEDFIALGNLVNAACNAAFDAGTDAVEKRKEAA